MLLWNWHRFGHRNWLWNRLVPDNILSNLIEMCWWRWGELLGVSSACINIDVVVRESYSLGSILASIVGVVVDGTMMLLMMSEAGLIASITSVDILNISMI